MKDQLTFWEKLPVAGLFLAQGMYVLRWYVGDLASEAFTTNTVPTLQLVGGVAAMLGIDGAMIATVAGMRAGRRSWWSAAAIITTAAFGASVALHLYGAFGAEAPGAWLHAGFAVTIACYLLHLAQPIRIVTLPSDAPDAPTGSLAPASVPQSEIHRLPAPPAYRRDGYVYVAQSSHGPHKIGWARNVEDRMRRAREIVPFVLTPIVAIACDDAIRLEVRMHRCFASRRREGEWFDLTEQDIDTLLALGDYIAADEIDECIDILDMVVNSATPTLELSTPAPTTVDDIVAMREQSGMSFGDIGTRLGISRQLAWQRYRTAKKQSQEE